MGKSFLEQRGHEIQSNPNELNEYRFTDRNTVMKKQESKDKDKTLMPMRDGKIQGTHKEMSTTGVL